MARMAPRVGADVWGYSFKLGSEVATSDRTHSALCRAFESTIPYFRDRDVCKGNKKKVDHKRWWPLWMEAKTNCPYLNDRPLVTPTWLDADSVPPPSSPHAMISMYQSAAAIAPFWNLGRAYSPHGKLSL